MENEVRIPIVVELVVRIKIEAEGAETKTAATVPVIRPDTARRLAEYEPKLPPLFDKHPDIDPYGIESDPHDVFKCEFCGKMFEKERSLRTHKFSHTSKNPRFHKKMAVELAEATAQALDSTIAEIVVPLQCPECSFRGKNKASIAQHRSKRHGFGRGKDPWLESDNRITAKVNSHIATCPNPRCIGGKTFVHNVGFKANGEEWCSEKCFDNYLPPAPKVVQ